MREEAGGEVCFTDKLCVVRRLTGLPHILLSSRSDNVIYTEEDQKPEVGEMV